MLSLQFIRENGDKVKEALANKHDVAPIDEILSLTSGEASYFRKLSVLRPTAIR